MSNDDLLSTMEYREGNIFDGRYRLQQFIGSGSFGEVWVAVDIQTDMEVAIKIYISMDKHGLEEFKKEFQVSFDLNQTNLLHSNYLGVNSDDNRAYLIMPYCPEGSVSSRIGQMDEKDLWVFVRDVASGLAYLHSQQPPIIHQDIKPDNILISRTGDYLITDFGISRQVRNTLRRSARSANVAGAPAYMGPERFSSNPLPVKASDIWSLGATIYELATGDLPFCGMGGVMQKNGADITELPGHFSDAFKALVYSCLALETWDRPSAKQLAEEARIQLHNLATLGKTVVAAKEEEVPEAVQEIENIEKIEDTRKTMVFNSNDIAPVQKEAVPLTDRKTDNSLSRTVRADSSAVPSQTDTIIKTSMSNDPVTPPDGRVFSTNDPVVEKKSSIGVSVWVGVAVIGLCCGFLLNILL